MIFLLPWVNLAPRDELWPLGGMFTPLFNPRVEHTFLFGRTKGRTEGLHPWGVTAPLGDRFHTGCQLHPWSTLGTKLNTGLSPQNPPPLQIPWIRMYLHPGFVRSWKYFRPTGELLEWKNLVIFWCQRRKGNSFINRGRERERRVKLIDQNKEAYWKGKLRR
jgi:hypothetical protein